MGKLGGLIDCVGGMPRSRIETNDDEDAPIYDVYSQTDLLADRSGVVTENIDSKKIRTKDNVDSLQEGDIVFSLISGNAAIVGKDHNAYLYLHNYIKLIPDENVNAKFLVYLLNEDKGIRKQLAMGTQGSQIIKYTIKQLKELELPALPSLDRQKAIGEIYSKSLMVEALKKRVAHLETILQLHVLEEEMKNDRS